MTTRIASFAANNQLLTYLSRMQNRVHDLQVQVGTEKRSQTYGGIDKDSERLVNMENTRDLLRRYIDNNELADVQLQISEAALDGMETSLTEFRNDLRDFQGGDVTNEERVASIQDQAYRTLLDFQTYLNTEVNGRYIFSGTKVDTSPVNLNLTNLSAFQSKYDGSAVQYPPTREAHVGQELTTATANTGNLTFDAGAETITAATAGSLSAIPVGATIYVNSGSNTGYYTVASNTGTVITVSGTIGATGVTAAGNIGTTETVASTLTVSRYYKGDTNDATHRASENRSFDFDINALDPQFEKAIRAVAIIAQGAFGTAGGLDQNTSRVEESLALLDNALNPPPHASAPYGTEQSGNFKDTTVDVAYDRITLSREIEHQKSLIEFYDGKISDLENVDTAEVITLLLDETRALEASYQAIARVRQVSLSDYL